VQFIRKEKLQIRDVTQELDALVTDGASRMAGRNSDMFSLFTNDVKNTTDRILIISHRLLHQESPYAKLLRISIVVPPIKTNIEISSSV
jgi:type IV pilus biogenesis protein CpaD/CtpE